ncbi:type I 3-dehydroquinate dehydratase [Alkalicoccobacillus murimartini]|uniref:3-dehydroquinate dehydratase n=1 Tax=Alkalicoccobacillus murimartini TaxID=171685 RepID=A0ABT9YMJ9_9BACI|nr:type I 3-dehydroquinate dehydratase [Alkalicoccobacillus murimartini]MDQ0208976.1 3-dehydroquinate dehydratase-1 [Alkalicoccobacillus murimartini]
MSNNKEVCVREVTFGATHRAAICSPLIGINSTQLIEEAKLVLSKDPDVLEWRADYFESLEDVNEVLEAADALRSVIGNTVLLFTIRSMAEGGQSTTLSKAQQETLLDALISSGSIDMLDIEQSAGFTSHTQLIEKANRYGVKIIISKHDFEKTPSKEELLQILKANEAVGADLVKLAVMPHSEQDVLSLLEMTQEAAMSLSVPVITMAMGKLGVSTRIIGDQFGSVMTFAVGHQASAPGQIPIESIKNIQKYTQN